CARAGSRAAGSSYFSRLVTTWTSARSARSSVSSVRSWLVAERSGKKNRLTKMIFEPADAGPASACPSLTRITSHRGTPKRAMRRTYVPPATENREQRLPDRVGKEHQRKPRRDLRVPLHQHERKQRQHQPDEIRPAVAEENPPAREIDQDEPGHARGDRARRREDERVVHRPRHERETEGCQQRREARHAVQPVD